MGSEYSFFSHKKYLYLFIISTTFCWSVLVFMCFLMQTIVEERDQERERRWKAEQAVRTLTEELKCLQTKFSEEKDLQNVALHATDR